MRPWIHLGVVCDSLAFLQKLFVKGPYEILDESYMDNHLLIDHLSEETPLKSIIPSHLMDRCWRCLPLDHKARNLFWARGVYVGRGVGSSHEEMQSIMDHIAKRKRTMTGGVTFLWRITIDEEKKQLDRGSTWAPRFPLMSKGEKILEGHEYCHQWQRGGLLIKVVIDVNMELTEI